MANRFSRALMAAAVFAALAVAATSVSAAPVVTHPTGTVLPVGSKVVGTSVGETRFTTSLGTVTCSSGTITGTLVTNSTVAGSKAEITSATFSGTGANGECTTWAGGMTVNANPATNGLPWCLEETASSDVGKKRGGGCSNIARPIRFVLNFTSAFIGTCTYQRSAAAEGSITTDEGAGATDALIHLTSQEWVKFEGGSGCPSSGKIDLTYTVETDSATPEPLYFSS
jgi:hypothetical protein